LFRAANELGPSWNRMKRKITLKLLQMQYRVAKERDNRQDCGCGFDEPRGTDTNNNAEARHRRYYLEPEEEFGTTNNFSDIDRKAPFYARFVWVNVGDSAAAAHDNFFGESSTAVMKRDAREFSPLSVSTLWARTMP
jgi:hypothetical protein